MKKAVFSNGRGWSFGRRWILAGLIALVIVFAPTRSDGSTLITSGQFFGFDSLGYRTDRIVLAIYIGQAELFDQSIDEQDSGTLFASFIGSSPNFAPLVSELTNGIDDIVPIGVEQFLHDHSNFESGIFGFASNGIDPQRLDIERIDVYLDTVRLLPVGPFPEFPDLMSTEYQFAGRIELFGTIPEPGSAALLASALFSICIARRRLR